MYLVKTPKLIQNIFPSFIWKMPSEERKIFLTFDDGPIPEVTPWVLDQLDQYRARATFFCVGENIKTHPEVYHSVIARGHSVGSHTFNHLSGWATDNLPYFLNVRRAATLVGSTLFRPPYGRIKPSQMAFLTRHYQIIMWDVLSGDFDQKITKEQCLENVLSASGPGSIIVFHDSLKSADKLHYVLPRVLEQFSEEGYEFEAIFEPAITRTPYILKTA